MEQVESGVAKSQHVVHVLTPGDARVASVLGTQVERVDSNVGAVQLLVLATSPDSAAWLARLVNQDPSGEHALLIPLTSPVRGARRAAGGAKAVVGSPADVLALVRGSSLKLDSVSAIVLVDANDLLESGADDVATLLSELPREAERVMVAREMDEPLQAFIEAHMRRARRVSHDVQPAVAVAMQYVVTTSGERGVALRRVLDAFDPPRATVLATDESLGAAEESLMAIGYTAEDVTIRIRTGAIEWKYPPPAVGSK